MNELNVLLNFLQMRRTAVEAQLHTTRKVVMDDGMVAMILRRSGDLL